MKIKYLKKAKEEKKFKRSIETKQIQIVKNQFMYLAKRNLTLPINIMVL